MEAFGFLRSLSQQCYNTVGLGSFSPAFYDTAWVSMVRRDVNGTSRFLFPEACDRLLQTQLPDGSWSSHAGTIDDVLNSLAALLAMKVHLRYSEQDSLDLTDRCQKAGRALCGMVKNVDINSADRVAVEIILPGLLRLLNKEGVCFPCLDLGEIAKRGEGKMRSLKHMISGEKGATLLHSLEPFIDMVGIDVVKHRKLRNGSMMNSPSSTAAYLINSSSWDAEAEGYLRTVMEYAAASGCEGGVPSAFPTSVFEVAWVSYYSSHEGHIG